MGALRVAPNPPIAEERREEDICIDIFDWDYVDESDTRRLARAALAGTTLAHLIAEAIMLGGDRTGVARDDVVEDLLLQLARFNEHVCSKLEKQLAKAVA